MSPDLAKHQEKMPRHIIIKLLNANNKWKSLTQVRAKVKLFREGQRSQRPENNGLTSSKY